MKNLIKKINIFLFLITSVALSQNLQKNYYELDFEWKFENNPENKKYIELNIKAVNLQYESLIQFNKQKQDSLLNCSEELLRKIVKDRKHFYKAHINLFYALLKQKKYKDAKLVLKNLEEIIEYPPGIFYYGILLEKDNKNAQALEYYKRALFLYDEYLKTFLYGSLTQQEKEHVELLIDGKEESLKRIREKCQSDPEYIPMLNEEYIKNFDRHKFIHEF